MGQKSNKLWKAMVEQEIASLNEKRNILQEEWKRVIMN